MSALFLIIAFSENRAYKKRMRFFLSLMAMCAVLRAAEQPNILWITAEANLGAYA